MFELEKAYEMIIDNCELLPILQIPIDKAVGYVCAEDLISKLDMPPFDKSAVDGYAFKWNENLTEYKNRGIIPAGNSTLDSVKEGECISIMTGAPLPEGTDTVIMIENTDKNTNSIIFNKIPKKFSNVCYKGEDIKQNTLIFSKGKKIKSSDIALLTASGYSKVMVSKKPYISILNTGSEIIEPGKKLKFGQIYNTNGIMLRSMTEDIGINAKYIGIASDVKSDLRRKISEGLKSDILLISGGVSMGEFDLVPKVLISLGVKQVFHKVAIKPGKPVFFGKTDSCLVFGLPGNPLSNFVGFELFVKTAVRIMTGERDVFPHSELGIITGSFKHRGDRINFFPAIIENITGKMSITPVKSNGSADVFSLSKANGFLVADIDRKEYAPGDTIEYITF
ncbi:MAG: molybdopterin molybdotransferase MoeA [Candidatus Delongbacteria bacterium]|nr:molybdopterin molybdotransferase MoeA [Candidatus Delongbacteria bacterium]MCG2759745.1 molybdopterin molybdotransferase MoeA [Candidatus Delongbacteria bacterium]